MSDETRARALSSRFLFAFPCSVPLALPPLYFFSGLFVTISSCLAVLLSSGNQFIAVSSV